jgi:DNA polymerase III epsilon subunit-like protein
VSTRPHILDLPNRRLVAVDVETNGLHGDVRVLSLGVAELRRGVVARSQAWLFNPGDVRMEPGAIAVNGLTPDLLEGATSFAESFEDVAQWFRPGPEHLTLVAHNATFDANRLRDEFRRLGHELPALDLLDTGRLAEAAGVQVANRSLAGLLNALGLANTAPHTALSDTLAVAAAAAMMMRTLAGRRNQMDLAEVIDTLCVAYDPDRGYREVGDDEASAMEGFTEAHRTAHYTDISDGRRRGTVLNVCLGEHCEFLARRMEDGVRTSEHAKQVVAWALDHLETSRLPRVDRGRLLRGVGQALRRTENPDFVVATYHGRLAPYLARAKRCSTKSQCERCSAQDGTCDFVSVLRRVVDAFLREDYNPFRPPRPERLDAFLPGYNPSVRRHRGRPPQGFYGELARNGHLDAAGYGAARLAQQRRLEGGRDWTYAVLAKAWNDGCRTPRLVEMLASMTVVDAIGEIDDDGVLDPKAPVSNALAYIEICFEESRAGHDPALNRLAERRQRLEVLATSPTRPPRDPTAARNRRVPHPSRLGVAPELSSAWRPSTTVGTAQRISARGPSRG